MWPERKTMKRILLLVLFFGLCLGCGAQPTPDAVGTQVAVMKAAAATLTAEAPAASPTPVPATPTEVALPTAVPATAAPTEAELPAAPPPPATPTDVAPPTAVPATAPVPAGEVVPELANQAVLALKNRDMQALAALVHPISGLRFTPYAYVQPSDLVFPAQQLPGLFEDPTVYHWGVYDGSGEPMDLTFAQYYEEFVYDQDYAQAEEVGYNERLGTGNSIDNSQEFYPGAFVVEYHFPGFDPQYAGMDWRSLRLVFQQHEGTWYLVGVVHDEWTI
jgi:hypothetical protein